MSSLERRCRRLLRAYPAWYRRGRGEEMLGTLLEASPPGRRWPSFRDTRALVIGGLRVRGWTWLLSVLWVMGGVARTGYEFYVTTKPYGYAGLRFEGLSAGPVAVRIAGVLVLFLRPLRTWCPSRRARVHGIKGRPGRRGGPRDCGGHYVVEPLPRRATHLLRR